MGLEEFTSVSVRARRAIRSHSSDNIAYFSILYGAKNIFLLAVTNLPGQRSSIIVLLAQAILMEAGQEKHLLCFNGRDILFLKCLAPMFIFTALEWQTLFFISVDLLLYQNLFHRYYVSIQYKNLMSLCPFFFFPSPLIFSFPFKWLLVALSVTCGQERQLFLP